MAHDFSWAQMDSWGLESPELCKPIDPDSVVSIYTAQAKVEALFDRLASDGFDIQGWDDGTITPDAIRDNAVVQPTRAVP